jgi:hypothetical protein
MKNTGMSNILMKNTGMVNEFVNNNASYNFVNRLSYVIIMFMVCLLVILFQYITNIYVIPHSTMLLITMILSVIIIK